MAQRFRTDLKDEIVQGGIKFWRAVTATGSILLKDFKMERTNANTQEGSAFGAKEANAIHEFLNGLLEGTETVKKATGGDMLRTFDRSAVWHDDRLLYVHEVADGKYELYVQEPNRVCKVGTDYAKGIAGAPTMISWVYFSRIVDGINSDGSTAFLSLNVGSQYDGCVAIITPFRQIGTPYHQIRGWCAGPVISGILTVEVYGVGFIPQHTIAFEMILAK